MKVSSRSITRIPAGLAKLALSSLVVGFFGGLLTGCSTQVDSLRVAWRDDGGAPVSTPSERAQCPDLTGVYLSRGRVIESTANVKPDADLHALLVGPLAVRDMDMRASGAWDSAPNARVAWSETQTGWSMRSEDGRGNSRKGRMPKLNGAADAEPNSPEQLARSVGPIRYNGCADGRLWVATSHTWTQYESMSTTRSVAVLRPEQAGLRVSVVSEHRSIGLMPWWSSRVDTTQYWFDRSPATP